MATDELSGDKPSYAETQLPNKTKPGGFRKGTVNPTARVLTPAEAGLAETEELELKQ